MVVQASNLSEPSTELRPLNHDEFFTGTFKQKRLAKAFLRIMLPGELLACLDLDGLTAEPRHITDDVFKQLVADVVYRVPIKGTDKHIDFFVIRLFRDCRTQKLQRRLDDFPTVVLRIVYRPTRVQEGRRCGSGKYRVSVTAGDCDYPSPRKVEVHG
jgi:hypothetical protein